MLRVPGSTNGGIVSDALVEHVDIMATLVEAAGLKPVPECPDPQKNGEPWNVARCTEGTSFLSLARPSESIKYAKNAAFSQVFLGSEGTHVMGYSMTTSNNLRFTAWVQWDAKATPLEWATREWALFKEFPSSIQFLKEKNKAKQQSAAGSVELYNHTNDPHENENIAPAHVQLSAQLLKKLRAGWREQNVLFEHGFIPNVGEDKVGLPRADSEEQAVTAPLLPRLTAPSLCSHDGACWPQSWILGAQQSGSASLYLLLAVHFQACGALISTTYLDWVRNNGFTDASEMETHALQCKSLTPANFTALYPSERQKACVNGFIEATPSNLYDFKAPQVLVDLLPGPEHRAALRFVAVLREPIAREISAFYHQKRDGVSWSKASETRCNALEHSSFDSYATCLLNSYHLILEAFNSSYVSCESPVHQSLALQSDLYNSMYALQLELWFKRFSRSQVLVISMQSLISSTPPGLIKKMGRFLRMESTSQAVPELAHLNKGLYAGATESHASCETRVALMKVFSPLNDRLYTLLALPESTGSRRPPEETAFSKFPRFPIQCN
jgi:hypothetical protein